MQDPIIYFQWRIPENGYQWVKTRAADPNHPKDDKDRQYLTSARPIGSAGHRIIQYHPLKEQSGLFRIFADLELTPEAIKAFADRFGSLGGEEEKWIVLPDQKTEKGHLVGTGEARGTWVTNILRMRRVVALWDSARKEETNELSRYIIWNDKGVHYESHPDLPPDATPEAPFLMTSALIAAEHVSEEVLARFVPGDVIRPAFYYIQSVVNEQLRGKASPRILWKEKTDQLGVHFVPAGLLGALWLQFAQAIERDNEFRRCSECGIWYELSPQTARSNKTYCSSACRTKAYRKRRIEAVRLHGEGLSVAEIAQELHADVKAVTGWVAK